MSSHQNYLSLKWYHKVIPYAGDGEPRPDGSTNFGFKNLKQNLALIDAVPELKEDSALMAIVSAICRPECGLLTIGCVSADVKGAHGSSVTGYLEFAINSKALVKDATSYFPLFFGFDEVLNKRKFSGRVLLVWELQPARFSDANAHGYTCAVVVNTGFYESPEHARRCWQDTFNALGYFLGNYPVQLGEPLY